MLPCLVLAYVLGVVEVERCVGAAFVPPGIYTVRYECRPYGEPDTIWAALAI